jgi:integrase
MGWKTVEGQKGLQYMEKKTGNRKGPRLDKYYRCHFQVAGEKYFRSLGWESEGMTLDKAIQKRAMYLENTKAGVKPRSIKEELEVNQQKAKEQEIQERQKALENMTFAEFWTNFYFQDQDSNKTQRTWKLEKGLYHNYIKPVLGHLSLQEISKTQVLQIKRNMADKSDRLAAYALTIVKQIFNKAIEEDIYTLPNPVKRKMIPHTNNQRRGVLTKEEEKKLLPALANRSQLMHDITLTSLYTGMRFSEIARVRWQDIDWKKHQITIYNAKDPQDPNKVRYASFPSKVKKMLKARYKESESELAFPGKGGKIMSEVSDTFTRVVDELGINNNKPDDKRIVFYSLRHTFATRLVERGFHQFVIAELMGHKNIKTTKKYVHADNVYQSAVAALEDQEEKPQGKVINGNFQ